MAAKYRKIDPRIWSDESFRRLNAGDKLIALYCLTSSQTNRVGIFYLAPGLASEQLGTTKDRYAKGIRRVCDTLHWQLDEAVDVLYLPAWWRYNGHCGPKTMTGLLEDLHELPQTPLLQEFTANRRYLSESESAVLDTLTIPLAYPSAFDAQEQEQEQEQECLSQTPSDDAKDDAKKKRFTKPTLEEVQAYCLERKNTVDPEYWHDHYTTNGWKVGLAKNPMRDWKAAVRTWERSPLSTQSQSPPSSPPPPYVN